MRTYKLSLGLISLSLLLESCSLFSIDPDEIDIADDDEVGEEGIGTGDGDGDAGTETGGSDEGSGTTTDAETTANDAGSDTGDDTTGESGTTDESGTTGDTATTDSSETGGACEDFLGINECGDCVSGECCDALLACVADQACFCTLNCQNDGGSEQACVEMCGPTNELVDDLNACTAMNCAEPCL